MIKNFSSQFCSKGTCCSVPLLILFLLQCLLIGLSFFAVIYELTTVQQKQFNDAVYNQIDFRMMLTNNSLQTPIRIREVAFSNIAYKMMKLRNQYILTESKTKVVDMANFFDDLYVLMYKDPIIYAIIQLKRSSVLINSDGVGVVGVAAILRAKERILFGVNWNQSAEIAFQNGYPTQYTVAMPPPKPNDVTYRDWTLKMFSAKKVMWLTPAITVSPLSGAVTYINSLVYPIDDHMRDQTSHTISLDSNITALGEIMVDMLLTPETEACLVLTLGEFLLKSTTSKYVGLHLDELPDRKMYATFIEARGKCKAAGDGICELYTYETRLFGNGEVHIASFLHMNTPMHFEMELLELTPRSYFFEEGDSSIKVGITIGCCAAVLVLLSSVVIWIAIRQPLLGLQGDMQLAAEMRNDEIESELQCTLLREIVTLRESFRKMNSNLLAARPFMPQALLCLNVDNEDEVNDIYYGRNGKGSSTCKDVANSLRSGSPNETFTSACSKSSKSSHDATIRSFSSNSVVSSLIQRNVAVLSVNVCGWHTMMKKGEFDGCLDQLHTVLCEMMERRSGLAKGIIDSFQGDHFIVTFNAAKVVGSAAKRAAKMALDIEEEVVAAFEQEQQSNQGIHAGLRGALSLGAFHRPNKRVQSFSMGLSAGKALVGNLGTASIKKFCTIGQVFTIATSLERLAKRLGRLCVLDRRTLSEVELDVYFLLLGEAELVAPTVSSTSVVPCGQVSLGFIPPCSYISSPSLGKVYALMEWIVSAHDDEWLYEVQGRQQRDPYHELNAILSVALVEIEKYHQTTQPMEWSVYLNKSNKTNGITGHAEKGCKMRANNSEGGNGIVIPVGTVPSTVGNDTSTLEVALLPSLRALAGQLGMALSSDTETVACLREYCHKSFVDREGKKAISVHSETPKRDTIVADEVVRVAWLLFLEIERINMLHWFSSYKSKSSLNAAQAALTSVVSMVLQSPSSTYDRSGNSLDAAVANLYFEKF